MIYTNKKSTPTKDVMKSKPANKDFRTLIVLKKNNVIVDDSVIMIWKVISERYGCPLIITKRIIMGKIPDISDNVAYKDYFKKYSQTITSPKDTYDVKEAIEYYQSILQPGTEMGSMALMDTLIKMYVDYEVIDRLEL